MKMAETVLPFGVLTANKRIYVIVQNHGYEDESYSILELVNLGISTVIRTDGGG